jgi:hypothetical protein
MRTRRNPKQNFEIQGPDVIQKVAASPDPHTESDLLKRCKFDQRVGIGKGRARGNWSNHCIADAERFLNCGVRNPHGAIL